MVIFVFDHDFDTYTSISAAAEKSDEECIIYHNENIKNAIKIAEDEPCCVIFIDTRLHGKKKNSFSIASSLREKLPESHIIFVSAYQEDMIYCLKNLIRPSAFLLKPLSISEVESVLNSVVNTSLRKNRAKSICISTHEFKRMVEINKILYFATLGKKLVCYMITGEKIEFYGTIRELANKFSEDFVRCHSGFLVNRLHIKGLNKSELELDGTSEKIPISKRYKTDILDDLDEMSFLEPDD
jgi:DNA-binding LytR/AlgR family response regulator